MALPNLLPALIDLVAVLLLALGIKGLSKVSTARSANGLAALAMGLAVLGLLIQQPLSAQAWLWIAIGTGHRRPARPADGPTGADDGHARNSCPV